MDEIDILIANRTGLTPDDPRYQSVRDAIEQALQEAKQ